MRGTCALCGGKHVLNDCNDGVGVIPSQIGTDQDCIDWFTEFYISVRPYSCMFSSFVANANLLEHGRAHVGTSQKFQESPLVPGPFLPVDQPCTLQEGT